MDEARQASPWSAVIGWVALGMLVFALGGLLLSTPLADARGPAATAVHIAGILALAAGLVLIAKGLLRATEKPGTPHEDKGLESQAERLGQPTEPEAYQDGGLAVATTAYNVEEAELIASVLRGEGIPAWVDGAAVAGWYWHFRFGLSSGGVRITVPMGRLADAQRVIAEHAKERTAEPDVELGAQAEIELEDPGAALHQSARRLAYLLLIGLTAPIVFVLAVRLLLRIRRQRIATGPSDELQKARRLAIGAALTAGLGCGTVGAVLTLEVTRSVGVW